MKQKIDLQTWDRKDHFEFYTRFKEPYHGVNVSLDISTLKERCKAENSSVFIHYLHRAIIAVNKVEAFRYRILNNEVYLFDTTHVTMTIAREHAPFGFSFVSFNEDFNVFEAEAKQEFERVRQSKGLDLSVSRDNVVHFSALPWIDFTGITHARDLESQDCSPKITFGKITQNQGRWTMPVSVHVHHGLVYGRDVADFIEAFQEELNRNP
jgi:chloramphenicol O-acetyltransferase type A